MTQANTPDPWAAASATPASVPMTDNASSLAGSYAGQPSSLFAPGGEGAGPSLFNQTHAVGTERTGIIAKAPYDKHSTTIGVDGKLKYWQQGSPSPVTDAVNPNTGQPNRPCMDTVIVLDTDYAMDAQEASILGREVPYEGGQRSVTVSGDMKLVKEAVMDYNRRHPQTPIAGDADMVGKRLTVKRTAQRPNPKGGSPIKDHAYRIDNA